MWPNAGDPGVIAPWGPPLFLWSLALTGVAEVSLLGRLATEQEREWRSRFHAWILIVAAAWLLVFGTTVYGALWLRQFNGLLSSYLKAGLAAGWLTTVLGGLLAANGSKTQGGRMDWRERLVQVAPFVFLIGLLCACLG